MIAAALLLVALAVTDLVPARPVAAGRRLPVVVAPVVAGAVTAAAAAGLGFDGPAVVALAAAGLGVSAGWSLARRQRPAAALVGVAVLVGLGLASPPAWPEPGRAAGPIGRWLADLPYDPVAGRPVGSLVLGAACALLLTATGNEVVRCILATAGAAPPAARPSFRGGRSIGAMERLLIFGFAVSGSIAAAAVVATLKGIVRFPEITRMTQAGDPDDAGELLEYFLVGSLASWGLALATSLLFVG